LIVGLISTDDEPAPNVHHPRITIKQGGQIVREYREFDQIYGEIFLNPTPPGKPLARYVPKSKDDPQQSLDLLVLIDQQLYPKQPLKHEITKCRAILQFNTGTVYTLEPLPLCFVNEKTREPNPVAPTKSALKVGLDVQLPEGGYAVLHFTGTTEDFVFKGHQDFDVEVINAADSKQLNHFKYLYNLVNPTPEPKWVPAPPPPGPEPMPRDVDYNCIPGGYGDPPPPRTGP
jgi:hypothetical protein